MKMWLIDVKDMEDGGGSTYIMAIRVVEFSNGGYKIRKALA